MATSVKQVQDLYQSILGRSADPAGLDFWLKQGNANPGNLETLFRNAATGEMAGTPNGITATAPAQTTPLGPNQQPTNGTGAQLAPGFYNEVAPGGDVVGPGDPKNLYQYYMDQGYTLAPDGTVVASTSPVDLDTGAGGTDEVVQLRLSNGNAGGFDSQGNLIDLGRPYDEGTSGLGGFMNRWGVPIIGAALGGIAASWAAAGGAAGGAGGGAGLTGSEGTGSLFGGTGSDTFGSNIWNSVGNDLGNGLQLNGSLQNATMGLGNGLNAASLTGTGPGMTLGQGLSMTPAAADAFTAGTGLSSAITGGMTGTEVANAVNAANGLNTGTNIFTNSATTGLPNISNAIGGPQTLTNTTLTPLINPSIPKTVTPTPPNINTPFTPNKPQDPGINVKGLFDAGLQGLLADQYGHMFDKLLNAAGPFESQRSGYFGDVRNAVNDSQRFQDLNYKSISDPNFWTNQSWLSGIGDYATNSAQRKLASQGYNYSGNTQQEVAKTLRDTMAQYIIPGQQNINAAANTANNRIGQIGSLAGAQFNPAIAMGPLTNLVNSGLNQATNAVGSLNSGLNGTSVIDSGLNWLSNQFGKNTSSNDWKSNYDWGF